ISRATLPATGARATVHSKHCGVRNTFVDLLSSFQRPTDPFLPRASDCDALRRALRPDGTGALRTALRDPRQEPTNRLSQDPFALQGSRCLADPSEAVKKTPSGWLIFRLGRESGESGGAIRVRSLGY